MKFLKGAFVSTLAVAALGVVPAAQASCNVQCLTSKVAKLTRAVNDDTRALRILNHCLGEVPVSEYGDRTSNTFGYVWNNSDGTSFDSSALDVTNSGDPVGSWFMTDRCNTSSNVTTNVVHASRAAVGPLVSELSLSLVSVDKVFATNWQQRLK